MAFLALLALSVNEGDKVLLFSQSVPTLNFIELCLNQSQWGSSVGVECEIPGLKFSKWQNEKHYARITGSTPAEERQRLINIFNHKHMGRNLRLFLISTKAGNMGINLVSANRVVIFDSSWNPANDLQVCDCLIDSIRCLCTVYFASCCCGLLCHLLSSNALTVLCIVHAVVTTALDRNRYQTSVYRGALHAVIV